MKNRIVITTGLIFSVILSWSYSLFAVSYYRTNAIGTFTTYYNADAFGRGGTALSIVDRRSINTVNPASLVFTNVTRLSASLFSEQIDAKTNAVDGRYNYFNLHNVKLAVPLVANRFAISLGLQPLSRNSFSAETDGTLESGSKYTRKVVNKGGINQIQVGIAGAYKKLLTAGIIINYNFGNIEENWRVQFASDLYTNTSDRLITYVHGTSIQAGLMSTISPNMTIGATYSLPITLKAERRIEYSYLIERELTEDELKIPGTWGIGFSYILKNKFRFSTDIKSRPYNKMKLFGKPIESARSGYAMHFGIEKLHSKNRMASFLHKTVLRAGFAYEQLPVQITDGTGVNELLGTVGLGIPFYGTWGRFDIGLGYGQRGNLDPLPVKENIVKLLITISGGEKWFVRGKK